MSGPNAVAEPSRSGGGRSEHLAPLSILFRFLRERKGLFAGTLFVRLIKDLLPFQGPILVGMAVDLLSGTERSLFGIDLLVNQTRSIAILVVAMVVLALLKIAFGYMHTIVSAHLGRHVVEAARRDMAEATMQMALDERRRFNSGDLLDRSLADSKGLRSFTQSVLIRMISNTARAIYPVALMFIIDPLLAVIVLAVIPLQFGLSNLLQRRLQRQTREARQREAEHTSAVKEAIDGWSSVASVGGQNWVAGELQGTASASEDAKMQKKHTTALISAVITFFTQLGVASLYLVGGWRIISSGVLDPTNAAATGTLSGALTLGSLVTFIAVAKKTYAPFEAYSKIAGSYRSGIVNLERIGEVLNAGVVDPRPNGPELDVDQGEIRLNDVTFAYDGAPPVLDGLTGTIPGRQLTVITGSSGTGKTTLLRLLMGLDIPNSGTVTIDGQDVNQARLSSVRRRIALVPQEPMLFTGSLGENLMIGKPFANTDELLDACHKAGLLELVRSLPNGLDTEVGSGRHMLSGGQLRRMAIARALLRRPAVLLLDEPTAGLDRLNSEQVLDTLRQISASTTVIMVSHRSLPLARSEHHLILGEGSWTRGVAGDDSRLSTANPHQPIAPPRIGDAAEGLAGAGAPSNGHAAHAPAAEGNGNLPAEASQPAPGTFAGHSAHEAAANGSHATGDGSVAPPAQTVVETGHRVIGLSAMGRPIVMNSIVRPGAVTNLLLVTGHRATCRSVPEMIPSLLHALASIEADVGINAIADLNPDAAWTDDGRTILGVDPAADHHRRVATETLVMHRAIGTVGADLIVDIAHQDRTDVGAADVQITIRHRAADATTSAWMQQVCADIERRLAGSRFSYRVVLEAASADSITAAWGTPVVEITAATIPGDEGERRQAALTEAVTAAQGAAALSRPELAAV